MKTKAFLKAHTYSSMAFFALLGASAWAPQALSEVLVVPETALLRLDNAFIANKGFDDNDNAQVVIEGQLPNSCYSLAQSLVERDAQGFTLEIRQNAIVSRSGICENMDQLPPDLAAPRRFWKVLDLGLLAAGDYEIRFSGREAVQTKPFRIDIAPTDQTDTMAYVQVGNLFANDRIDSSAGEFEIRVTGELTSSCAEISKDSRVERVGDVFVVLLGIERTEDFCLPANRPFYRILKVKAPEAGRYLVHARSVGGESRNKIIEIF